jgi:hypothetical protein
MMIHFLWTVKNQAASRHDLAEKAISRSNTSLVWWLLLPVAWFGPFIPGAIVFDAKSLLVTASAVALFFYIRHNWRRASIQAEIFKPGDIYHLLKHLRLTNPVLLKRQLSLSAVFTWPQAEPGKTADSLSLTIPGLLWFAVLALLMISLLLLS